LFDVAVRILQKVLPPRTTPPLPTILGSSILSPNSTKIEKRFEGSFIHQFLKCPSISLYGFETLFDLASQKHELFS
jgi:hypothetical protein